MLSWQMLHCSLSDSSRIAASSQSVSLQDRPLSADLNSSLRSENGLNANEAGLSGDNFPIFLHE